MKKEVSPVVAWVIIAIIVVVAGFFVWRYTGAGGRGSGMTPEMRANMSKMFGNKAPGGGGPPSKATAPIPPGGSKP